MRLRDLEIPSALTSGRTFRSSADVTAWEDDLIGFFSQNYELFTPFPRYFELRCYEFRVLRGLLADLFALDKRQHTTLELGCGFGFRALLLTPYSDEVIGVDIPDRYPSHAVSELRTSVEVARAVVNEKLGYRQVRFLESWPQELPLDDASVDLLYSEYVLEHIPDLDLTVREMDRVLRPGGRMVHVVPNTKDAMLQFLRANVRPPLGSLARGAIATLLRRPRNGPRMALNGTIVPPRHSEFVVTFGEQLDVYHLEHYLFPMVQRGLYVERVLSTREHNNVLVIRKRDEASEGVGSEV